VAENFAVSPIFSTSVLTSSKSTSPMLQDVTLQQKKTKFLQNEPEGAGYSSGTSVSSLQNLDSVVTLLHFSSELRYPDIARGVGTSITFDPLKTDGSGNVP
jgi:hypothetical protein